MRPTLRLSPLRPTVFAQPALIRKIVLVTVVYRRREVKFRWRGMMMNDFQGFSYNDPSQPSHHDDVMMRRSRHGYYVMRE